MIWRVEFAPGALEQAQAIEAWWSVSRGTVPELFRTELAEIVRTLTLLPMIGRRYDRAALSGIRRLLLPRCRYHVYYELVKAEHLVRIHAVWHAARGQSPPL